LLRKLVLARTEEIHSITATTRLASLVVQRKDGVMARKLVVHVTCDVCGAEVPEGTATVAFTYGGQSYETDLCDSDRLELDAAVGRYVTVAHTVSTGRARSNGSGVSAPKRSPARRDPEQVKAIRDWARSAGYALSDRGRIPSEIEAAYNKRAQVRADPRVALDSISAASSPTARVGA
jgi:hypothetical protein